MKKMYIATALSQVVVSCHAQFVAVSTNPYAWSENAGWISFAPIDAATPNDIDATRQPFFGPVNLDGLGVASGFAWAENLGWINLGDGSPADGVQYANTDGSDFGVNITEEQFDPSVRNLTGFAWSENAGWINFGPFHPSVTPAVGLCQPGPVQARIELSSSRLRGFAWAENFGWINFDACDAGQFVFVRCLADVNEDTQTTPADFTAWVVAFNSGSIRADQNRDGVISPADFTAWVVNYNVCVSIGS